MSFGSKTSTQNQNVNMTNSSFLDPWTWQMLTQVMGPQQIMGLEGMFGDWYQRTMAGIDPTNQLNAANNYFSKIAAPAINNQLAAAGFGNSGAQAEAAAQAGAQMALPIQQNAAAQMFNLNTMLPQLAMQALQMSTAQNTSTQKGSTSTTTKQPGGSFFSSLAPLAMMAAIPMMSGLGALPASSLFGSGATGMSMSGMASNPGLYGAGAMASPWGTTFLT